MARKQVATRLDEDTVEAFEDYVDNEETPDRNNSDAFRRFVREGLANRDYQVAVADGGVGLFDDRLEALERQSTIDSVIHDVTLLIGVAYVTATLTLPVGGLDWLVSGVIVFGLILLGSSAYRMRVGE